MPDNTQTSPAPNVEKVNEPPCPVCNGSGKRLVTDISGAVSDYGACLACQIPEKA